MLSAAEAVREDNVYELRCWERCRVEVWNTYMMKMSNYIILEHPLYKAAKPFSEWNTFEYIYPFSLAHTYIVEILRICIWNKPNKDYKSLECV